MTLFSRRSATVYKPNLTDSGVILLFCALLSIAGSANAQASHPARQYYGPKVRALSSITAFKQTSPGAGWVMLDGRLLWTDNDGAVWRDITPPGPPVADIDTIFALDSRHLWAVTVEARRDVYLPVVMRFLRTTNGGRSWSTMRFDVASFPKLKEHNAYPVELSFVDPDHGWFLWRAPTGTQASFGFLLSTKNGGRTWKELPAPPSAHGVGFYSAKDGWTTGQPNGDELWVTHDAGQTWMEKTVPPPENCKQCRPAYSIPRFRNRTEGVVGIIFQDETVDDDGFVSATYVTHDGGNSWRAIDIFDDYAPFTGDNGTSCEAEMDVVRVFSDQEHSVRIRTAGGAIEPPYPPGLPPSGLVGPIDFVDLRHGWLGFASTGCLKLPERGELRCQEVGTSTELLSTSDGGRTLRVISPARGPNP